MTVPVDLLEFTGDDVAEVVAVMGDVRGTKGWLTLDPEYDEDHPPPSQTTWGRLLSGRGPYVPRATWVPAQMDKRTPEPMSIGILHAKGSDAVELLAERDIEVPDRWRVTMDHPKRGLVVWVPVEFDDAEILDWTLRATRALTRIPLTGRWRAAIHRPV